MAALTLEQTAPFFTEALVQRIQREAGSPVLVYDEQTLVGRAKEALAFPNAFGLTARYAMKACPTAGVVRVLTGAGLHIDASSGFEAERALRAGVPAGHVQITAQELPRNLSSLLQRGCLFTACSLHQLQTYGRLRPGTDVCVRINPGLGSGHSNRTNVGGPSSSFGIWHEHTGDILAIAAEHGLTVARMHTHIGSGGDPEVWKHCAALSLAIVERLPQVHTLSLGGGFKVGRMPGEPSADLNAIGNAVKVLYEQFAAEKGRQLALEIEPGTFLVANACALLCTIIDVVDTGPEGHRFIKVDSGMTELVRPAMYGAQHPMCVVPTMPGDRSEAPFLVAGHCCESGDVWTPAPGDPEGLEPRTFAEPRIGDPLVLGGAGAYGAAMSCKNYNSFPEAAEYLLQADGTIACIRARQTLDQMLANERTLP